MAKKNGSNGIAKVTKADAGAIEHVIGIDASVGMDDITAVRLSQIEVQLNQRDADIRAAIRTADKDLEAKSKEIAKALKSAVSAHYKKQEAALVAALKPLFPNVKSDFVGSLQRDEQGNGKNIWAKLSVAFQVERGYGYPIQHEVEIAASKEVLALDKELAAMSNLRESLYEKGVETRRMMSQMAGYERQLRGQIARIRLNQTENGKAVIAQLDAFDIAGISDLTKALPKLK